jgi:hypothetical protein
MSIHRHELDFEIFPNSNLLTIVFVDASDYMEQPERPLLEVTPPGYSKYFLVNIVANRVNTLNSNIIGLTETLSNVNLAALPDGVWTFKYKICPYDKVFVRKCHLRTTALECSINNILNSFDDVDCSILDNNMRKEIIDILLLIEMGKAAAEKCDTKKAGDAYTKAHTKVKDIVAKLDGCC